jgi:hypothetical protein
MTPKRSHAWPGFALFAALAILGLFVLHGAAAGAVLFVTMLVFIFAGINALRSEDPASVAHNQRTGLSGWFGGWF